MTAPPGPRTTRGSCPVPEWNVSGSPMSSATAQNRSYSASLYGRCGTRREEERTEPAAASRLRLVDGGVDVEHRHEADGEQAGLRAEHLAGPVVVRAAQRELERGVVGARSTPAARTSGR